MVSENPLQAHVSIKHRTVAVPATEALRRVFPRAKEVSLRGVSHLALPHLPTESFLLRKVGFDLPSPVLSHYDWCGGSPFEVQKKTVAMLTMNERAYVLNGLGTGKTRSGLWAYDFLKTHGLADKMLVLAPLSTLTFTWAREIFDTLPHRRCAVLHGTREQRLTKLADRDTDIYILNHDGLKVIFDDVYKRTDINVLLVDELAVYRNGTSQRTKTVKKLAQRKETRFCWGMTGAPIPNSPCDAWAQAAIITPHTVPKFFSRFREELMLRVSQFKWAPKPDAVEKAFSVMQPAVRFTLDDIMELPERVERTLDVPLGDKQAKVYKSLVDHAHAMVKGKTITAANAGAVMSKLLQVACGWVYSQDKGTVALDNDERIKALVDAVLGADQKVLVFVPFKHALSGISKALTAEGIEHATVSGDTPASERNRIFSAFQNTSKYKVIAAHPQCLAHGITLTSASVCIWFSPVTSLEIFEQAEARLRRVGQKNKQLYLYMQGTPIEKRIYTMLRNKQKVQDKFLGLFEEATSNVDF